MKNSRQKNYLLNSGTIVLCKLVQILLSFVLRTFLIQYLGEEILGLDGLFSSVLSILCLTDLGINSAIIYSLYIPISEKNFKKITAYISFYKRFYMVVGSSILILGILLVPFLDFFVNLPSDNENIVFYYILTVIQTAISYFFSSRRAIFEADQRNRIITISDTITNIILQVLQIILIQVFHSYSIVLTLRIIIAAVNNICIYIIGNKEYPFLGKNKKEQLNREEKISLYKYTGAVLCHKVGSVLVTGTDSLIISTFVNTIITGYYSNYYTIINSVSFFVTSIMGALTPSIGNLRVETDDIGHHYEVFEQVVLLNFLLSSFCAICLYCILNPFITLWLGSKYIFDTSVVLVLSLNFYFSTLRFGVGAFGTAAGLFKETLAKPLLEGIINLIVSIILVQFYGIIGVFIGTLISLLLGSVWVDPYVLFKKWFLRSTKKYFCTYICMFLYFLLVGFIISCITQFMPSESLAQFVIYMVATAFLTAILLAAGATRFPGYELLKERVSFLVKK